MPFRKQTAWGLLAVVVATGIALMVGRSEQTTGKPPPIPKAGPLAKPRSLNQVGLPVELTQKVIPQDNPQTPEKRAGIQTVSFPCVNELNATLMHVRRRSPANRDITQPSRWQSL